MTKQSIETGKPNGKIKDSFRDQKTVLETTDVDFQRRRLRFEHLKVFLNWDNSLFFYVSTCH